MIKDSGVYFIRNKFNGSVYIGSTTRSISLRIKEHKRELRNNRHENKHLQYAFNKYGENNFEFIPLEYIIDPEKIVVAEQKWIDHYTSMQDVDCYNMCLIAGVVVGIRHSKDSIERVVEKTSKIWPGFKSPDGQEYRDIKNLELFCREHGLDAPNMRSVHYGKSRHHKGWTRLKDPQKPIRINTAQIFSFRSPSGEIYTDITNLSLFCRERKLRTSAMHSVFTGRYSHHKGWTRIDVKSIGDEYRFKSPEEEIYRFGIRKNDHLGGVSLKQFCEKNGLWYSAMLKVHQGKQKSHMGWTKYESSPVPSCDEPIKHEG